MAELVGVANELRISAWVVLRDFETDLQEGHSNGISKAAFRSWLDQVIHSLFTMELSRLSRDSQSPCLNV